jgi:hypothetical protein
MAQRPAGEVLSRLGDRPAQQRRHTVRHCRGRNPLGERRGMTGILGLFLVIAFLVAVIFVAALLVFGACALIFGSLGNGCINC